MVYVAAMKQIGRVTFVEAFVQAQGDGQIAQNPRTLCYPHEQVPVFCREFLELSRNR